MSNGYQISFKYNIFSLAVFYIYFLKIELLVSTDDIRWKLI